MRARLIAAPVSWCWRLSSPGRGSGICADRTGTRPGHGALDSVPDLVALFPLVGLLLSAGLADNFVFVPAPQVQLAALGLGWVGAVSQVRAGAAVGRGETDPDDGQALLGMPLGPLCADGADRAGHLLAIPIDGERVLPEGAAGRSGGAGGDRPVQVDAVLAPGII